MGDKQFFPRRFAIPIEKYGDVASLNQLRSLVQPFKQSEPIMKHLQNIYRDVTQKACLLAMNMG
ncbi:hypothetical protein B7O87_08905 [Cylindrospermopsis raciborskii CENA303]|uniref:Uncharacterized protein n=1 Tax=Cylindrospermopsis raciborskii CENA303 TaxID=1170769 RepID=A0A1X4G7B5_9CYAN|nr:hypothetical protein B7O87_08905 [Cylindrospermopsis raciborskii CENA303]